MLKAIAYPEGLATGGRRNASPASSLLACPVYVLLAISVSCFSLHLDATHRVAAGVGDLLLSWNCSIARCMSARQAASSSVQESGGRPPLLWPRLMAPRVGWKRMPISLSRAHLPHEFLPTHYWT